MEVAERCSGLRYLCISNCPHLTDQSLAALANHCPDLVTLECAGLSQLTDAGFQVAPFIEYNTIPTARTVGRYSTVPGILGTYIFTNQRFGSGSAFFSPPGFRSGITYAFS